MSSFTIESILGLGADKSSEKRSSEHDMSPASASSVEQDGVTSVCAATAGAMEPSTSKLVS